MGCRLSVGEGRPQGASPIKANFEAMLHAPGQEGYISLIGVACQEWCPCICREETRHSLGQLADRLPRWCLCLEEEQVLGVLIRPLVDSCCACQEMMEGVKVCYILALVREPSPPFAFLPGTPGWWAGTW